MTMKHSSSLQLKYK